MLSTYEFFIPHEEDGTGVLHPPEKWDGWEIKTQEKFKGLTRLPGDIVGWWLDTERNKVVRDMSRAYVLAIPRAHEKTFISHMKGTCALFMQKCLFVERRGLAALVAAEEGNFLPPFSSRNEGPVVRNASESSLQKPISVRESVESYNCTAPGSKSRHSALLAEIRNRIDRAAPYLDVAEFALGVRSPLLRAANLVTASVVASPDYQEARGLVTDYGMRLGLLRTPTAAAAGVAEPQEAYGRPSSRCVSQLQAARVLGWPIEQVRSAIASGTLRSKTVDGATVVDQEALAEMS